MIKKHLYDVVRHNNEDVPEKNLRLHSCECNWSPKGLFNEFFNTLEPEDFLYYQTTNKLKQELADFHGVEVENVFVGPGSDSCIKAFVDLFEEGTEVWTTNYYFPMYEVYAKLNNHKFKTAGFPCEKQVVLLSNPNSPLGTNYTTQSLQHSAQTNGYVLIDEAYIDYSDDPADSISLIKEHKNVVITRSFSKGLSGAGARIGYAIGDKDIIELMSKFRSMFELTGASIKFASYVLANYTEFKSYCNDTIEQRPMYIELFRRKGYKVFSSQGNWIHVQQTDSLIEHLNKCCIIKPNTTLPASNDKWIRLTIGPGLIDFFSRCPING